MTADEMIANKHYIINTINALTHCRDKIATGIIAESYSR